MTRQLTVILAVLSVALVAAIVVWVVRDNGSSDTNAEVVTAVQLSEAAAVAGHPVYWLGPRPGTSYELTEGEGGPFYVRYLSGGAAAGDERADFVTVATYPQPGGVASLRRSARERPGAKIARTDDGAVLLVDPSSPKNAHLAYPGADLQIEVYSPAPGEALRLASRGKVQRVR
ncbi:MAG TPA: hypothetical protein VHQ43_00095 [Solirubrobacterales bacterium]|nr:hypothetical protein [Solirubrobacterales bacterium]